LCANIAHSPTLPSWREEICEHLVKRAAGAELCGRSEDCYTSIVIPGKLAIWLQPEADPPLAEARPGIQEV